MRDLEAEKKKPFTVLNLTTYVVQAWNAIWNEEKEEWDYTRATKEEFDGALREVAQIPPNGSEGRNPFSSYIKTLKIAKDRLSFIGTFINLTNKVKLDDQYEGLPSETFPRDLSDECLEVILHDFKYGMRTLAIFSEIVEQELERRTD